MANNKRYYWLKLKEDFFRDKKIKKLRSIAGGDTYTIIYLKMQLLSLKDEGKLFFDNVEDSFIEEIALEIDENADDVKVCIMFLIKNGLLEAISEDEYVLIQTQQSIGSETAVAGRVRKFREIKKLQELEEQKMLQCNTNVTNCNIEIEKEIEIEIEKKENKKEKKSYGEFKNVLLTDEEYAKLEKSNLLSYIETLSSYIASKGKKYKSHYATILTWSRKEVENIKNPYWQNKNIEIEEATEEEEKKLKEKLRRFK